MLKRLAQTTTGTTESSHMAKRIANMRSSNSTSTMPSVAENTVSLERIEHQVVEGASEQPEAGS